jgi:ParB/Sulfiredoxin domain
MAIRFPRHTAAKRQKALAQAEKEFARSDLKRGKRKFVSIRTREIKERLELFQPREFSYGARSVDPDWVKELARRIGSDGELDPVLVIRIGKEWVCVDGHHRIAAYRLRNHKKPIRCEWFAGTPTEAVDESMRRNKKDTLPISSADRREEAWRRVLLKQGSKKEIAQACNIGTSTVSNMRMAIRRYESDPEFAARVGRPLMETSWGMMLLAAHDVDYDEADLDERAGVLARNLRRRLSDQLTKDPVVTALALGKLDRNLPRNLMGVWTGTMGMPAPRGLTEPKMKRQIEVLRRRADSYEAMLADRAKRQPEAFAAALQTHEEQQERRRELWRRTSTEKETYEF